jgi:hypothetical protein
MKTNIQFYPVSGRVFVVPFYFGSGPKFGSGSAMIIPDQRQKVPAPTGSGSTTANLTPDPISNHQLLSEANLFNETDF